MAESKTREVTVLVGPDGKLAVTTAGFAGKECLKASAPYEAMGGVASDTPTPEMNATPTTSRPADRVARS